MVIGDITLTQKVHSIDVESSWQTVADTATVMIPKNIRNLDYDTFKPGDRVSVSVGYQDKIFEEVFRGFVKQRKPNIPFEILCEDAAYLFRSTYIQKNWKSKTTLKEIVEYLIAEQNKQHPNYTVQLMTGYEFPEVNFSKFRISGDMAYHVLDTLQKKYGLALYFRDLEMYFGLPYGETVGKVKYDLGWNTIQKDTKLEWREETDYLVQIKAIGIKKDNTTLETTVGNEGGSVITKYYYGIEDKASLKLLAEEDFKREKITGYKGTLTAFFIPFVKHSMIAEINDPDFPERLSEYRIDRVRIKYDKGIRNISSIGGRVV